MKIRREEWDDENMPDGFFGEEWDVENMPDGIFGEEWDVGDPVKLYKSRKITHCL